MTTPLRRTARRDDGDSGVALILGIVFTVIIAGLVVTGTLVLRAHRTKIETGFRLNAQAAQFARAGVIEALAWFRKSPVQPVASFAPVLNSASTPPILETVDPDIGLVREFPINGAIWGRYEVWKQWDTDPDPTRLAWRQQMQCQDITAISGATGIGTVWSLRGLSYVFRRVDPTQPYDVAPNQVLATHMLSTEIRRMTLAPPGQAAICSRRAASTTVNNNVHVTGGTGAGIFSSNAFAGSVVITGSPTITGSPGTSTGAYDDSVEAVFGVSQANLRVLADQRVSNAATFPSPLVSGELYYVEVPTLQFTPARPLSGSAVIYVKGDVDFTYNHKSFFTGLLYVDGNVTVREPCEFNGTLICTGTLTLTGTSDWINFTYDDGSLNRLRTEIGQYRMSAALRRPISTE